MKKRRKIVLFVGAGASRACGYPVTGDILPRIVECLENKEFIKGKLKDEHIGAHAPALLRMLRHLGTSRCSKRRRK